MKRFTGIWKPDAIMAKRWLSTLQSEVKSEPTAWKVLRAGKKSEICFQNRVPDRMIVALLDSRAFNGDYTRNCFCFQKFDLTSIKQIVRGEEYPYKTLELVGNDSSKDLLGVLPIPARQWSLVSFDRQHARRERLGSE